MNGKLFEESWQPAAFDRQMRDMLLEACAFDWGKISPAIFGSMFQEVMNQTERRNFGAHYTSEKNIQKLIKPLFLDELYAEFEKAKGSKDKLEELHKKIASLHFLDPACGCGNFLIITYRELRDLELEFLKELYRKHKSFLDVRLFIQVDVDQFAGMSKLRITKGEGENYELGITNDDRVLVVPKSRIAANGDYNLSGERYRESTLASNVFPLVRIGHICIINPRKNQLSDLSPDTLVSFVPMADINEHQMIFQPIAEKLLSEVTSSYTYFEDNDVLFAKVMPCFENGKAGIAKGLINGIGFGSSEFYVLRSSDQVLPEFLYFCINHPFFRDPAVAQMTGTGGLQRVLRDYVENSKIPLPPIAIQKEIVTEIEGYQKVINGARAVIDNYRPHIAINPDWEMVKLSDVCEGILTGPFGTSLHQSDYVVDEIPVINPQNIVDGIIIPDMTKTISELTRDRLKEFTIYEHDILIARRGEMGRCGLVTKEMTGWLCGTGCFVIRLKPVCDVSFVYFQLTSPRIKSRLEEQAVGVTLKNLNQGILSELEIPVPLIETP